MIQQGENGRASWEYDVALLIAWKSDDEADTPITMKLKCVPGDEGLSARSENSVTCAVL